MMVLLKNMMDEIRSDTSGYNTELWHYRVSGNILELTVQLSSRRDRKGYRTAVISAGQAIRTLTSRLEELDITHSFRAFPAWNILNWSHRSDSTIPTEVKKGSLLLRQLLNRSAAVRSSFLI